MFQLYVHPHNDTGRETTVCMDGGLESSIALILYKYTVVAVLKILLGRYDGGQIVIVLSPQRNYYPGNTA